MYESGDKAGAVEVYRRNLDVLPSEDKPIVFSRLIDFEADRGNKAEARRIAERAEADGVVVSLQSEKGKELMSEVWREKEMEREAALQAERAKQAGDSTAGGASSTVPDSGVGLPAGDANPIVIQSENLSRLAKGHRYVILAGFENRVDEWFMFEIDQRKIAVRPSADLKGRVAPSGYYWVEGDFTGFQEFQTVLGVQQDIPCLVEALVMTDEEWEARKLDRIRSKDPEVAKFIDQVEAAIKVGDRVKSDFLKDLGKGSQQAGAIVVYLDALNQIAAARVACSAKMIDDARKQVEDARKNLTDLIGRYPGTRAAVEAKKLIAALPPTEGAGSAGGKAAGELLLGTWEMETDRMRVRRVYRSDGTYTDHPEWKEPGRGALDDRSGTWAIKDGKYIQTIEENGGEDYTREIIELNEAVLTVKAIRDPGESPGEPTTWHRVKD